MPDGGGSHRWLSDQTAGLQGERQQTGEHAMLEAGVWRKRRCSEFQHHHCYFSVTEMGADRQQLQTAARRQQSVPGQPKRAERRSDGGGVQPVAHPAVEVHSQPAAVARHRRFHPSPSRPRTARAGHALAPQRKSLPRYRLGAATVRSGGPQGPWGNENTNKMMMTISI